MATVLQPIVNELNTVLVQLRTELRGLQTDADGAGIAIGARVCAISLINQNQQRQEVCFSMSSDALTLRSDMSKNQVFICMQECESVK